jgi:UDP-N-acetylmuramate--alanine ligase
MAEPASAAAAGRYHFVGIGGIGMSAIARLLLRAGNAVSGSDERPSPLLDELVREGAEVSIGHRAENVGSPDFVVVSSAISAGNPEYAQAVRCGIPIVARGEMLARIIGTTPTVAIAGTHGKTTTTAMVAAIFEGAGLDPTVAVGGQRIDSASNARRGGGNWFITESDESDGSFLRLSPTIAVVTNIENDHIASDAELPALVDAFAAFLAKLPPAGAAIVGIDNVRSAALVKRIAAPVTTFGTGSSAADLRAVDISYPAFGSRFTVVERGSVLGPVALGVPGVINVQNALAAIGAARAAAVPFATIAQALGAFAGVRRRFEIVGRGADLTIVDDYAHHPTAVAQTIAAARAFAGGPVFVAFQPHRYSRTAYLAADFARALRAADHVYLTPVYAAAEAPIAGVSERLIGEPLAAAGTPVTYAAVDELEALIRAQAPAGTLVLMLGAGSISAAAHRFGAALASAPLPAG